MRFVRSMACGAIAWLLLLIGPCWTPAVNAQDRGQPAARELLLFEEPVVSAAAKHSQSVSEAPSAVSVITREDILRFGYRTLAEALQSVRGFYGSNDRNYRYVGVRGFLRPGDYNDRILLLVNGHSYNDDVYQSALLGSEFGIDLEAVHHIEVIRGPGSALYGGNAMFAVINVVTLTAADASGIGALAETGSFGRKRGQVSVGHVFDSGLEVFSSGSFLDLDGQKDLYYPEYDSPETNNGIAHKVDGQQAFNYFLSAKYGDFTFQGGLNQREKHLPTGAFDTLFNDSGSKTQDMRPFAELGYSTAIRPDLTLTARVYYDGYLYDGNYIYETDQGRVDNVDRARSHWYGSEVRLRWDVWADNSLTGGAEFTYHPNAHQENYDDVPGGQKYLDDDRTFNTYGFYLQDEWRVRPNLTLVAGLRFDSYYDRLREVNPRVAGIWQPLQGSTVKLLFGQAFRPPNLWEQYYTTDAGVAQLTNPNLDSERITTYEGALEQELWHNIRAVASVYHYDMQRLIEQISVGTLEDDVPIIQYKNTASVSAQGAEFELQVPLPHDATLRASYALQEARTHGRLLTNSPKHLGHGGLLFPLPYGFKGGLDLLIVGPRNTLAGRQVGTEGLVNLTLRTPPLRGFTVSAGFYNILDQNYSDPASTEHRQDRIEQDGFTFRFQVQYAF